jgi:hypothetical protein
MEPLPDGRELLIVIVSDGAGSAKRGGAGSEIAVESMVKCIIEKLSEQDARLGTELVASWVSSTCDAISEAATKEALLSRDFACTLLGVVALGQDALAFQIGDGAIVVGSGASLRVPIWPMGGEYANMTHFVTDDDADSKLEVMSIEEPIERIAVFSDGIQILALNMSAQKPHLPFFLPLFNSLAATEPNSEDTVNASLVGYLSSDQVNQRTDDDKTLVLAHRV